MHQILIILYNSYRILGKYYLISAQWNDNYLTIKSIRQKLKTSIIRM
jgi:hypothetical protein